MTSGMATAVWPMVVASARAATTRRAGASPASTTSSRYHQQPASGQRHGRDLEPPEGEHHPRQVRDHRHARDAGGEQGESAPDQLRYLICLPGEYMGGGNGDRCDHGRAEPRHEQDRPG